MPKVKNDQSLTKKQRKYLEALPSSNTKAEAALKAGYSESVSRSIAPNIERAIEAKIGSESFQALLNRSIPDERLISKIDALLDAYKTFAIGDEECTTPDNTIQFKALELAIKCKGHLVETQPINNQGGVVFNIKYAEVD